MDVMCKSLLVIAMSAAPRAAFACPVCFGKSDSPMAIAMNMGIIVMLVVVAGVLGGFASFCIYLMRRARRVAAETDPGDAGRYAPSEGTAQ